MADGWIHVYDCKKREKRNMVVCLAIVLLFMFLANAVKNITNTSIV